MAVLNNDPEVWAPFFEASAIHSGHRRLLKAEGVELALLDHFQLDLSQIQSEAQDLSTAARSADGGVRRVLGLGWSKALEVLVGKNNGSPRLVFQRSQRGGGLSPACLRAIACPRFYWKRLPKWTIRT